MSNFAFHFNPNRMFMENTGISNILSRDAGSSAVVAKKGFWQKF